jgi:hypothetical protein
VPFRVIDVLRFRWVLASLTVVCCAQPKPRPATVSPAQARRPTAPGIVKDARVLPRPACADSNSATPPQFRSFLDIEPHDVFSAKVHATRAEWTLAEPVAFPRHHAVRLEFSNQDEFPAFPEQPEQVLRVSFEVTSHDVEPVPGREQWRNTIRARLLDVCPLAE